MLPHLRRDRLRRTSDGPLILVLAPEPPAWLDRLPELVNAELRVVQLWPAARRAGTAWARGRADRRIQARFTLRGALDRLGSHAIRSDVDAVYAPSFCARRTFAAAARRSSAIECHLVEDLADLRQLHADLDRAAAAHPEAEFLRRHRATPQQLAWQEAERVLADVLHVRSRFAEAHRIRAGRAPGAVRVIGAPPVIGLRRTGDTDRPTLLLAGPASARAGTFEALDALEALPRARLLVRVGEGLEPGYLLDHPRVQTIQRQDAALERVDVVLAPAWCEMDLPELTTAARAGIPIVTTTRAAGIINVDKAGATIEPGDAAALVHAINELLTEPPRTPNGHPNRGRPT